MAYRVAGSGQNKVIAEALKNLFPRNMGVNRFFYIIIRKYFEIPSVLYYSIYVHKFGIIFLKLNKYIYREIITCF